MSTPLTTSGFRAETFFLSELFATRVVLRGKKVGALADLVIIDHDTYAEVTHLFVSRTFGYPSLTIPWENVRVFSRSEIVVHVDDLQAYEKEPGSEAVLLKDHLLDKKVLDTEDRDVEVVYDIKLVRQGGKLFVSDVDISRYGLLRRIGLKRLADIMAPLYKVNKQIIPWSYVQPLPGQLDRFRGHVKLTVLKERLADIPPVDLADILEELDPDQRMAVFGELDSRRASDTLEEIDPNVQRALISSLAKEKVASLIDQMTPAQAADILSILPYSDVKQILKLLRRGDVPKVETLFKKQDEAILNFAVSNILKLSPATTVAEARREYARTAKEREATQYIYTVDDAGKLIGVVDARELLWSPESATLQEVMVDSVIVLSPQTTLREVHNMFVRYGFRAFPITDEHDTFLGAVTYRDVMSLEHRFFE